MPLIDMPLEELKKIPMVEDNVYMFLTRDELI